MDTADNPPIADPVAMDSPQADADPWPTAPTPRPSLAAGVRSGARTAFLVVSLIVGPIAALIFLCGVVSAMVCLGTGYGSGIPGVIISALKLYLGTVSLAVALGAVIGLVVTLVGRAFPRVRAPHWWVAAGRPIRLLPERGKTRHAAGDEIDPPPAFRRRWPWVVAGVLLGIAALGVGTGVYLRHEVDRRLRDAVAAAERDDPHWQIDDLMANREPVPDAENSARVAAEVIALLPEAWPWGPTPPPSMPAPGAAVAKAYERLGVADNLRMDDPTAGTLRRELEQYRDAVELARTLADYRRGRHELVVGPTLLDTRLPETQEARYVARLLYADAALRAHDGDLDGAIDSCRAILGTARSIGDEPVLIGQLVRVAIGNQAMHAAKRVLAQGLPSDAALARFQTEILRELDEPLVLYAVRGERATMTELIRRVGDNELPISALSGGDASNAPSTPSPAVVGWPRLWFVYQRAVAIEWMNQAVAIARRPAAERSRGWEAWNAQVHRVKDSRFGKFTTTLPLLMSPAVSAADPACCHYQAELGTTALLLAAERQRRRSGEWPASAEAINPAILPRPPLDPFSGRPFLVRREDGKFIVHSIGPNHRDDHGAFAVKRWRDGGPDDPNAVGWDVSMRGQTQPRVGDREGG